MSKYKKYADYYDILHWDKDYDSECDFLEDIFKKYSQGPIRSILDLGCGTGRHILILRKRGYEVTGVDFSPKLIEIAKKKIGNKKRKINFILGDIRKINIKRKFDAVISMFGVMSYQITNQDITSIFKKANNYLNKGGFFIFDCWFGPAVLFQKPKNQFKIINRKKERVIKFVTPFLDKSHRVVDLQYKIIKTSKCKILDEFNEKHKIKYFFPREIEAFLKKENFKLLEICPFKKLNKTPTVDNWNITIIAKKL